MKFESKEVTFIDVEIGKKLCDLVGAQGVCMLTDDSVNEFAKLFFLKNDELINIKNNILSLNYFEINTEEVAPERIIDNINIKTLKWDKHALRAEALVDEEIKIVAIDLEMLKLDGIVEFYNNKFYLNWSVVI